MVITKKQKRLEAAVEILSNFDKLPDAAFIRPSVVAAKYGYSAATVWRHVKQGLLPVPHKRGGATLFNVGELRRLDARTAA